MQTNERLLSPTEVAQYLGVRRNSVTKWIQRGEMRAFPVGRFWRISPREVRRFLKSNGAALSGPLGSTVWGATAQKRREVTALETIAFEEKRTATIRTLQQIERRDHRPR